MTKFKKGDRVEYVGTIMNELIGKTGTVTRPKAYPFDSASQDIVAVDIEGAEYTLYSSSLALLLRPGAPQVGKRYCVTPKNAVQGVVRRVGNTYTDITSDDGFERTLLTEQYDWQEIEPEYAVGALYVDADGAVFERIKPGHGMTWKRINGGYCGEKYPRRPLERLYRESERAA